MANSYLPAKDGALLDWGRNFSQLISQSPVSYGLTILQAESFGSLFSAYEAAYNTAVAPETRTKGSIAAKNTAKNAMKADARNLVSIIQGIPTVTPQMKIDLGVSVRDTEPTPILPPTVAPEIDFMPTGTRTIRIRLHNEKTLNRRKPDGVKGATLFSYIGATPPADFSNWKFEASTTKNVLEVEPPPTVSSGTQIWFTAFWFNPRTQSGPAATPVSTIVQYGGLSMAA